ncbi:MAG: MBL fold metallo-hydrolase [Gammaproteobacteria bacterium]|nr:MBL fold metallo-hydrolase [Gammaproteobacteria bacterium]MDH5305047.1 MBL fold metallo-hydrolase [Gammaproteobacteria bacterium]MDH5322841.1 MBL fold metallo-hydrolase [Gammaproteobacteria bacterium]
MTSSQARLKQIAGRTAITVATLVIVVTIIVAGLWNYRATLGELAWPTYPEYEARPDAVTLTWLGVSTLLFDDGETQILIDGFISRPSVVDIVFDVPVRSEVAQINQVLDQYEMRRLAAIIPVHSHFDHAMDIGAIANRSSASILGSESTARIAQGAGVPDDQIVIVEDDSEYQFGAFTIRLLRSRHAPIGWGGTVPFDGEIGTPLELPAPVSAWRTGEVYSIVISHADGTTVVQGSAGFRPGALDDVDADVLLLGTWGLKSLGRDYTEQYWLAMITATGAKRILPIHFDDYTRPFGRIELPPRILDDFVDAAGWLDEFRNIWDTDSRLFLPEFGRRVVLYPPPLPEA